MLERHTQDSHRNRADDEKPADSLVALVAQPSAHDAGSERAHDCRPLRAVEDDQRERRAEMEHDDETEKRRRGAVDVAPPEHRRNENRVSETGDRKKFADALQQREKERLGERHGAIVTPRRRRCPATSRTRPSPRIESNAKRVCARNRLARVQGRRIAGTARHCNGDQIERRVSRALRNRRAGDLAVIVEPNVDRRDAVGSGGACAVGDVRLRRILGDRCVEIRFSQALLGGDACGVGTAVGAAVAAFAPFPAACPGVERGCAGAGLTTGEGCGLGVALGGGGVCRRVIMTGRR